MKLALLVAAGLAMPADSATMEIGCQSSIPMLIVVTTTGPAQVALNLRDLMAVCEAQVKQI